MAEDLTAEWSNVTALPGMDPQEAQHMQNTGKLVILFRPVLWRDEHQSQLQGRPVFKEKIHIQKIVPGDKNLVIDRPVKQADKEQFRVEWEHFEKTRKNKIPGIPIEHWHSLTEIQKAEFKAMHIHTIEQFAALPDSMAVRIMGFYDLREKAKVFIAAGKDAELLGKVRQEAEAKQKEQDDKIAELTRMVQELKKPKVHWRHRQKQVAAEQEKQP